MGPAGRPSMEQLVDAYAGPLYRYAYRLTGSAADADDLTQDTFCKAQSRLGQLRDPDRARSWLFSILRNAYLHRLRADKQQRQVPLDSIGDLAANGPVDGLSEVEPDRLQQALNGLPEIFRSPVILFYFEDFSYRDIAEQMELPLGTVMSRLARAKAMLRDRLGRPPEPPPG
jgi:RNA polymerase sigma-70 factor (ECF subfamily)